MALVIQKFGGSSLATPAHIRRAAERIRELKKANDDVVVVVSAMGRMTDYLIRLAHRVVSIPAQRELDMLMSAGERVSMSLLAMALEAAGVPAISFTGSQSGIVTSSDHTDAKIIEIRAFRIREELQKGKVVIVAGFQGVSVNKEITTLGRGGSDTTAVALAHALSADRCEILTDVEGLYSADPRAVSAARLIGNLDYDQALEFASLGAKMHGRSIQLARRYRVPVRVLSNQGRSDSGTLVGERKKENGVENPQVTGVATQDDYVCFKTALPFSELTALFKKVRVPLRFFSHSEVCSIFLCDSAKAVLVKRELADRAIAFEEIGELSLLSVVGDGLGSCPDFLSDFLATLRQAECPVHFLSGNTLSFTVAIPTHRKKAGAEAVHRRFVTSSA